MTGPYEEGLAAANRGDYATAVRLWKTAASDKHPKALFNLGRAYETGKGVRRNFDEAENWYRKAAREDHAAAHFRIAEMYNEGRIDGRGAVTWLRSAAELGHLDAQAKLGDMYLVGNGVREDHVEGMKWLQRAALRGHSGAQCTLGYVYDKGKKPFFDSWGKVWPRTSGVSRNYAEAIKWYQMSAAQGNTDAQLYLGYMYETGRSAPRFIDVIMARATGVPKNHVQAAKWYRMAAELGRAAAQACLGLLHANGQGVSQDYVLAHMWSSLAIGHFEAWDEYRRNEAVKIRNLVAAKMTPPQIAEAQRLAREWMTKLEKKECPKRA